ncbi:MAG: SAM hydrolase/SAM-dependent halogenase family protein [Actinocrinis sp.]
MAEPVITFLSDYGLADEFVGVCHGVIARACPAARVIDLGHGIARGDVLGGAVVLADALPFLPVGVHLAVVDPGVGGPRRALALALADGRLLVGPDNGLLSLAAAAGGGVLEAAEISDSRFALRPVSASFHGRDLFAPVAAALAGGAALVDAGVPVAPDSLAALRLPRPHVDGSELVAHVLIVDRFGNLSLDARGETVGQVPGLSGERVTLGGVAARRARTFADVQPGGLLLYEDSRGRLAVAVREGDAALRLGLHSGDELRIGPP